MKWIAIIFSFSMMGCESQDKASATSPEGASAVGGSSRPAVLVSPSLTPKQRKEWSGALEFFSKSYDCPVHALEAKLNPDHPEEVLVNGCGEEMSYKGDNSGWMSVEVRF